MNPLDEKIRLARLRREFRDHEMITKVIDEVFGLEPQKSSEIISDPAPGPNLRQLVNADASWDSIKSRILTEIKNEESPRKLAGLVELAFVSAPIHEQFMIFKKAFDKNSATYWYIHPQAREGFVRGLLQNRIDVTTLATLLVSEKDSSQIQPIERFIVFQDLAKTGDTPNAYTYYHFYAKEILQNFKAPVEWNGWSKNRLFVEAGKVAAKLGYEQEAREILSAIPDTAAEYNLALEILLSVSKESSKYSRSTYDDQLQAEKDWRKRLDLLGEFLLRSRTQGGIKDRNRMALNELLKNPLRFFDKDPEQWRALSELLVRNLDLENLLPQIAAVFKSHIVSFYGPELDSSLWFGIGILHDRKDKVATYWTGIALLHRFIAHGVGHEASLWRARRLVRSVQNEKLFPEQMAWRDIYRAAVSWITKSPFHSDMERMQLLGVMRIAAEQEQHSMDYISDYLKTSEAPPIELLEELQDVAAQKGAMLIEWKVIETKGFVAHLTNRDLGRLWRIAITQQSHDLAWRVATVIQARRSLALNVKNCWEISGEKRSAYPVLAFEPVEELMVGLTASSKKFIRNLLTIGPKLPELIAHLDGQTGSYRSLNFTRMNFIKDHLDVLADRSWFQKNLKKFKYSFDALSSDDMSLPAFFGTVCDKSWALLLCFLGEQFGLYAWGWSTLKLMKIVEDILPKLAVLHDTGRVSTKVATWIKTLKHEERTSWHELMLALKSIGYENADRDVAKFFCRFALCVYPNHYEALTCLQEVRAPIYLIWDLEAFLLSGSYQSIRKHLKAESRVPVPQFLNRIETIIE